MELNERSDGELIDSLSPPERVTLDAYEAQAEAWGQARSGPELWAAELERFGALCPGDRLLDVGSGNGRDAVLLASSGYRVTGVDISSALLKIAATREPQATFVTGSVYALPFADQSFDGIWAAAVLLHIPKARIREALTELDRVLCAGGALFITLKIGEGEEMIETAFGERFFSFWQPEQFSSTLVENGFRVLDWRERVLNNQRWGCFYVVRS